VFYDPAKKEEFYRTVLNPKLLRRVALKYLVSVPYVTYLDKVTAFTK